MRDALELALRSVLIVKFIFTIIVKSIPTIIQVLCQMEISVWHQDLGYFSIGLLKIDSSGMLLK